MKTKLLIQLVENPIKLDENVSDPYIFRDGNDYYLYRTGYFTITMYKSNNLTDWEELPTPFSKLTIKKLQNLAKSYGSEPSMYAPHVIKHNGKYIMYNSISWYGLCVFTADKATGPFKFEKVLADDSITGLNITYEDSYIANDNGKLYLVFGSHGNIYQVPLSDDGLSLADNAVFKHIAGNPNNPRRVYEGSVLIKHGKYWYLFAERGNYTSEKKPCTCVVGRSKKVTGPFLNKWGFPMTWGCATEVLRADSTEHHLGPCGIKGILYDVNNINEQDIAFYQRKVTGDDVNHTRELFLQQIYWDECNWPFFEEGVTKDRDFIE